ncbi:hypothetical protein LTS10_010518 [Elasticomyces elasticus]|nr:hypothetical protein LTS10_010518 [Elasticomyces elasticus]
MATQVNIDLANIGEQIAAAVKQAVEQATNKLLAANIKEVKDAVEQATNKLLAVNLKEVKAEEVKAEEVKAEKVKAEEVKATSSQDFSFDIRGQILGKQSKITRVTYYIQSTAPDSTAGAATPTPPLHIIIKSTDEKYEAEVRLQLPRNDRHIHHWGFLESAIAGSAEEALRKLLRLTTELLGADGEYGEDYAWRKALDEENIVDVEGLGFMWAPSVLEANAAENKRAQDHGFDIRGQILANAHSLWKLAQSYYVVDHDPDAEPGPSPPPAPLTVIVACADEGEFCAQVQLQQNCDNCHFHVATFIEGDYSVSVDEALQKLLRTTTELLRAEYGSHTWRTILNAKDNVHLEGLGRMWSTTGECDDCEEQVWT